MNKARNVDFLLCNSFNYFRFIIRCINRSKQSGSFWCLLSKILCDHYDCVRDLVFDQQAKI